MRTPPGPQDAPGPESLSTLLGGHRSAPDASAPPTAFVLTWLLADGSVRWASGAALLVAAAVAIVRWRRGQPPRAVLIGLFVVGVGAAFAVRTGRAQDFFALQIVANTASALGWLVSIALRWPLLGVVVGMALGQRGRWRRDPVLLRAYTRASWIWVGQYAVRLAVFVPLWLAGEVLVLGAARVALSWPLVAISLVASWAVIRHSLPDGHPGIRHPRRAGGVGKRLVGLGRCRWSARPSSCTCLGLGQSHGDPGPLALTAGELFGGPGVGGRLEPGVSATGFDATPQGSPNASLQAPWASPRRGLARSLIAIRWSLWRRVRLRSCQLGRGRGAGALRLWCVDRSCTSRRPRSLGNSCSN